jgi:hypothetical protein
MIRQCPPDKSGGDLKRMSNGSRALETSEGKYVWK